MAKNRTETDWIILYYHLTTDCLSDPKVKQHLPENGKRYEVELYTRTDADNFVAKGTCIARYEEKFDIDGITGKTIKNSSKWFETMPNGEEREVTDIVLRFRKIQ